MQVQVTELVCKRCKERKPLQEFDRGFFGKKGYDVYCHDCRRERDTITEAITEKRCRQCGKVRPISKFARTSSTRDGYFKECLECREGNRYRKREQQATSWKGEMKECGMCGMLTPTFDLTPPRFRWRNTLYCRRCINKIAEDRILRFDQEREEHGWPLLKRCKGCGKTVQTDRFYLDRRKKDGFSEYCDACLSERYRERLIELKERHDKRPLPKTKKRECSVCHAMKPVSSFSKNRTTADGLSDSCKACVIRVRKESTKIWSAEREKKGITFEQMLCRTCNRVLPIEMFTRATHRKKGYRDVCKDCLHALDREFHDRWEAQRKRSSYEFSLFVPTEKACKLCGEVKPLTEFWRRRASKDGLSHYCKSCMKRKTKRRNQLLVERGFPEEKIPIERQCTRCKRTLPQTSFARNAIASDGLCHICKDCMHVYDKLYRMRPEVKQSDFEYNRRPEVMERRRVAARAYQKRPEVKERVREYKKKYRKRDYVKERLRAYDRIRRQRPEVKQKQKEYDRRPEVRARKRISTKAWRLRKKAEKEKALAHA